MNQRKVERRIAVIKRLLLTVALLAAVCSAQDKAGVRSLDVLKADGGSVQIPLGYNVVVNNESSLHRTWFVLNDPSCPLQLVEKTGVNVEYREPNYRFVSDGAVSPRVDTSAFESSTVLFNLWGDHLETLSLVALRDLRSGDQFSLAGKFSWYASEADATEYVTSVTYVRNVRLGDGKIWRADMRSILRKLADIQLKASEEKLDARPPQDKK